jgi:hypothetical protein
MSVIKDAITAMKEVVILSDKVERSAQLLDAVAGELREHDSRLVRLETMVEIAQSQKKLDI